MKKAHEIIINCAFCKGIGKDPFGLLSPLARCQICIGEGRVSIAGIESQLIKCAYCKGSGVHPFSRMPCTSCLGKGVIMKKGHAECTICHGTGAASGRSMPCTKCGGKGII